MQNRCLIPKPLRGVFDISLPDEYRYLLVMMGLPLADGVFLSIVLTGGLSSILDSIMVGSFVLGGGATIGVILSEFTDNRMRAIRRTLQITMVIGLIATIQASIAPMIEPLINTELFKYGAILAVLALALRIAPIEQTDRVISPTVVIAIFLVVSLDPSGLSQISMEYDISNAIYAALAVAVAFTISTVTILVRPLLINRVDSKNLKYATSIGLLAVTLSIIGIVPSITAPFAFSLTAVVSYIQ